jgi:hypothetical protein
MTRRYNTLHPERSTSTYARKQKGMHADRYGNFDNGRQKSADRIAGKTLWYPVEETENVRAA